MAEAKKYGIVYADPPWRYDMKRGKGVAENHYPTMSIDELCALPVAELGMAMSNPRTTRIFG